MKLETWFVQARPRANRLARKSIAALGLTLPLFGCSSSEDSAPSAAKGGTAGNEAGSTASGGATSGVSGNQAGGGATAGASGSNAGGLSGAGGERGGAGGEAGSGGSAGDAPGTSGGFGGFGGFGGSGGSGGTAAVQPFPGTPIAGYRLEWADEFEGQSLETNKWIYRTDSKHWSTQLPANVTVSGGFLNLHLKKESAGGKDYTGAGTISKPAFRYGYYEARMQTPPGRGWHSSFWMMKHGGTGDTGTAATAIELDVIENDSINPRGYSVNVHRWNPTPHLTYGTKGISLPAGAPSLSAAFHVYGCEFTKAAVKYFLDGALVQTVDATQFAHSDVNIWITSIASYLGGTSSVDDAQLPAVVKADYVRFFVSTPP